MTGQASLCPISAFETDKLEVAQEKSADETPKQQLRSLVIFMLNLGTSFPFPQQTESAGHRSIPVFGGSRIPIRCVQLGHLPNLKQNHYYPVKLLKISEVWPKKFCGFYEFDLFPLLFAMEMFWLPGLWKGKYVGNKWLSWYCLMMTVEHLTFHRVITNSQCSEWNISELVVILTVFQLHSTEVVFPSTILNRILLQRNPNCRFLKDAGWLHYYWVYKKLHMYDMLLVYFEYFVLNIWKVLPVLLDIHEAEL